MAKITNVFSINLQALRKKKGVTQEQLASYLGVSPQAVSKWENGSYPEGDLLPKISEYFEVSISYLYGQENGEKSFEQTILEELYTLHEKEGLNNGSCHKQYYDKILDIAWAGQIACWKNNRNYFNRGVPEKDIRTASIISDDAGFAYFNLNLEKQYYALVREPEEGFSEYLKISEGLRTFFMALGEPGVLEIIFFLMSMRPYEAVSVSTLSKVTGIKQEKVQQIMDNMSNFDRGGRVVQCIDVVKVDGNDNENAYSIRTSGSAPFITLLLAADSLINPPFGYTMQVGNRSKAWFDRDKVVGMIKNIRSNKEK